MSDRCTYRGCTEPPVKRVRSTWDRIWWYGCLEHIEAMVDALYIGTSGKVFVEAL